jgi:hypothetical protein
MPAGGGKEAGNKRERGEDDNESSCSSKRGPRQNQDVQGQHRPLYKSAVDLPSVLRQLFVQYADKNGFLDASELAVLVRDVARTFDNVMLDAEVRCAVKNVLSQVGKGLDGKLHLKVFSKLHLKSDERGTGARGGEEDPGAAG